MEGKEEKEKRKEEGGISRQSQRSFGDSVDEAMPGSLIARTQQEIVNQIGLNECLAKLFHLSGLSCLSEDNDTYFTQFW